MAKKVRSFPGTLKNVTWGRVYEVTYSDDKKTEKVTSGLTGSAKEFKRDWERATEREISKITEVLTADELAELED